MKVLFVCKSSPKYGIVPFIRRQGESIIKQGVDLDFYTVKGNGVIGYLKQIRHLSSHIKNNNYEIIHAHYGLIGLLCGLSFSGLPIVLSVMGSDAYGRFNTRGKRIFNSYFIMLLTQISLLFSSRIIVKSKNILDFIPHKNKAQILPNGVDFELFKPTSNNLMKNRVLCLCDPKDSRKNFKLVKEAMSLINDDNIQLINPFPIEPDNFPKYLNESSVFVLSSYNEGSPNVIKEAMACNIPVISTDVGDAKQIIHNVEGCYITSFNPQDLANKIKKVISLNKRTEGRKNIKHLNSIIIAKKIINIYSKILKK